MRNLSTGGEQELDGKRCRRGHFRSEAGRLRLKAGRMDLRMRANPLNLFMKLPIQSLLNLLKVFKLFLNLPGEPLKSL